VEALGVPAIHVLTEELTRADAPFVAIATSEMVARVIHSVGSPELQERVLPKVLAGEATIALGMSEPEAGSDVAAIQTRARAVEGGWVIDGQKMFTTNGHIADYVFLLARTDPESVRHQGLTTFLVPLGTEGVEAQGVETLSGERTNITYYSDVFVEDLWRISEVGEGWASLMLALQDEHSAPFSPHLDRLLDAIERWAQQPDVDGVRPLERAEVRRRLAKAATDLEVAQLLEVRSSWMEERGDVPVVEGPMSKLFSTEAGVRRSEDLTAMVGPDALRSRLDPTQLQDGLIEHSLRFAVGMTIYAGTSEVQRNIIAQRRCGLPRS
jgi:alkylation response protein AidB-like acyl-CoA dehydrogenase